MQEKQQLKLGQNYTRYIDKLRFSTSDFGKLQTMYHILRFFDLPHRVVQSTVYS